MISDRIFLSEKDIRENVKRIAEKINKSISKNPNESVVILGIMDGASIFMCDLVKEISHPITMLFLKCHSYDGSSQKNIVFDYFPDYDFTEKRVIIVDEIVDTGKTIREVMQMIVKKSEPLKIESCSLIKRKDCLCYIDYLGVQVEPGAWLYGYGMDYPNKLNRNLVNIYIKS